ncbi:MAG: hypothetical protein U9Q69_01645 [Nanoarchaeota archaeon]|nr:hypothetical protein [Nanoarchaeota archaeon]
MRKNPRLFSQEEYNFLHQIFLKDTAKTKISKKIKSKKGVGLDLQEIKHVKKRYDNWCNGQDSSIFLPNGELEDRGF